MYKHNLKPASFWKYDKTYQQVFISNIIIEAAWSSNFAFFDLQVSTSKLKHLLLMATRQNSLFG